ncbi:MAG: GntR family transcriptional regulator [Burkholderiaceae bacterium]|nr:GntR family transcriptional regulator [Burkholderiaceae bacterium]
MQTDRSSGQVSGSPAAIPIERRALHEEVAGRLREMITEGVLAQGSRLNERVLCEQLRVSRTPLREAFKVLAGERLVELNPNRGAIVATLSPGDVEHLFELMASLEGLSGELAATRRSAAELDEIRAMHFEMLAAHARRDLPLYYRLNRGIHQAINRCARNPVLSETYDSVNLRIQNLRFRSNFNREKWDVAVREHGAMIEALAAGDAAALRELLELHLRHKRDAVLEELRALAQAPPRAAAD